MMRKITDKSQNVRTVKHLKTYIFSLHLQMKKEEGKQSLVKSKALRWLLNGLGLNVLITGKEVEEKGSQQMMRWYEKEN